MTAPVPPRRRLAVALLLGGLAAFVAWDHAAHVVAQRDFTQLWFAARAILNGQNPYGLIGPGLAYDWSYPLLYPLTAAIVAVPVAPLPQAVANGVFAGVGAAAFAWALTRHGWGPLLGFFSGSMLVAMEVVQWSPLFAAALAFPALGVVLAAKPTIGAAIFAARPSRWAIGGGLVLSCLAFVADPGWVGHWVDAIHRSPTSHLTLPVQQPGGFLILLALLRWRRWEARLLVVLACVPQTMMPYETVPLFLIATAWHEALLLSALSWGALVWLAGRVPTDDFLRFVAASAPVMVWTIYFPCVVMVLRRPNVAARDSGDTAARCP